MMARPRSRAYLRIALPVKRAYRRWVRDRNERKLRKALGWRTGWQWGVKL